MSGEWQAVEVYSTFLRIRGYLRMLPGQRLSDAVNRNEDFLELHNTITEPLLASYPVVSPQESNSTIAKSSVVMVIPGTEPDPGTESTNPGLRVQKVAHHVILNTTAFALSADIHLEGRVSLLDHLRRSGQEFLPVTRVSAVLVASLGGTPQALQRGFALVNPVSIVSFSVRPAE